MARTKMTETEKTEVAAVRDYLQALEQNAPRRGRRRTPESVERQLAVLEGEMEGASVTKRLGLIQQRIDLEADLEALQQAGSVDDIAGICSEGRNVVGLMPHPERACDELLGSADGAVLIGSLLDAT